MYSPSLFLLFFLYPLGVDKSIYSDKQKRDKEFTNLVFSHNVAITCQSYHGYFSAHQFCLYAVATDHREHWDAAEETLFCSFMSSSVAPLVV